MDQDLEYPVTPYCWMLVLDGWWHVLRESRSPRAWMADA